MDTALDITLTGSDPGGGPLNYSIVNASAHGTLTGKAPDITYWPEAGFEGVDSVGFRVRNQGGLSAEGLIHLTVRKPVWMFGYWRGEARALHLAYSYDAKHWNPVNNGDPVLQSTVGCGAWRDFYIVRGPEGLYHFVSPDTYAPGCGSIAHVYNALRRPRHVDGAAPH